MCLALKPTSTAIKDGHISAWRLATPSHHIQPILPIASNLHNGCASARQKGTIPILRCGRRSPTIWAAALWLLMTFNSALTLSSSTFNSLHSCFLVLYLHNVARPLRGRGTSLATMCDRFGAKSTAAKEIYPSIFKKDKSNYEHLLSGEVQSAALKGAEPQISLFTSSQAIPANHRLRVLTCHT